MFGKNDNLDEDYIAPVEEYRDECTDEHGMTYGNYNSEQSDVDAYSESYTRFCSYAAKDETVLWCGKTVKGAKIEEKGAAFIFNIIPAVIGIGFLLTVLPAIFDPTRFNVMKIGFIIFGIIFLSNSFTSKKLEYAITNKRIMIYNCSNKTVTFDSINGLFNINYYASPRNVGYVSYNKPFTRQNNANKVKFSGIYAIENPAEVSRILTEAVADLKK